MDWLTKLREPFFRTREEAEAYVTRELDLALPEGWRIRRSPDEHLTWTIAKERLQPTEWPNQEYCVRVSSGLDFLILTYGNNDVGCFSLHHVLQTALVIQAVMLRQYDLSDCLRYLFADRKPNEWGYT